MSQIKSADSVPPAKSVQLHRECVSLCNKNSQEQGREEERTHDKLRRDRVKKVKL